MLFSMEVGAPQRVLSHAPSRMDGMVGKGLQSCIPRSAHSLGMSCTLHARVTSELLLNCTHMQEDLIPVRFGTHQVFL